jgi:hypothetical protein
VYVVPEDKVNLALILSDEILFEVKAFEVNDVLKLFTTYSVVTLSVPVDRVLLEIELGE